jgi:hypothetical protein
MKSRRPVNSDVGQLLDKSAVSVTNGGKHHHIFVLARHEHVLLGYGAPSIYAAKIQRTRISFLASEQRGSGGLGRDDVGEQLNSGNGLLTHHARLSFRWHLSFGLAIKWELSNKALQLTAR